MKTIYLPPIRVAHAAPAVRVGLKPGNGFRRPVNGAWWPHSRDLARELPQLISVLDDSGGRVTRATVNVRMWERIPAEVPAGGHIVRLGWYDREQDPHGICLFTNSRTRLWNLLVIPPEFDQARAERLLRAATDVEDRRGPSVLMAQESSLTAQQWDEPVRIQDSRAVEPLTPAARYRVRTAAPAAKVG